MTVLAADRSGSATPAEFEPIAARLEEAGRRFRVAEVMGGLGRFLALTAPAVTVALFLVGFFNLWTAVNVGLMLGAAAVVAFAYARFLHTAVFRRPTYGQIARWIEQNGSELGLSNELINAVLLAQEYQVSGEKIARKEIAGRNSPWIPQVIAEISRQTAATDFSRAVPWGAHRRSWYVAAAMLLLALALVAMTPGTFAHALTVLSRPGKFVPRAGPVRILSVEPGNDTILAGQPVTFLVKVAAPENKIVPAKIDLRTASGKTFSYPMQLWGEGNDQYKFQPTSPLTEDVKYFITAGGSESEEYEIRVQPRLQLTTYTLDIEPPAYTGEKGRNITVAGKELTPARGSADVAVGTKVTVGVSLDMPVHEVILDLGEGKLSVMTAGADRKSFSSSFVVNESVRYAVQVNDKNTRAIKRYPESESSTALTPTSTAGDMFAITAVPDAPPAVTVTTPGRDADAKPGEKLLLAAQTSDDHGLVQMSLEVAAGKDGAFKTVQTWAIKPVEKGADSPSGWPRAMMIRHTLELPASQYRLGDTLRYRFTAMDNRDLTALNPAWTAQSGTSQTFTISFTDTAVAAAKSNKLWDDLRVRLNGLLDRQIALYDKAHTLPGGRDARNVVPSAETLGGFKKTAADIGGGQKSLKTDMQKLAREFPFEPSMKIVQKTLEVLVVEDATSAVDVAGDIALVTDPRTFGPKATQLRTHQARIIDILQSLLAISKSEREKPSQVADKEGGDVPNEAKKAWEKFKNELEDFKKEQKQVIDSTAELAKKPKDDFNKDDEKKMKELAATEDKWEKFLTGRLVDMSKVAEQDQANVSLLEEIVQMKVELAMAKNALEQQATEIATALEDNGLENAKKLTTHIERWLQQQPDRLQWKMEEPVNQNDPAMAELPKQLQDMMGDLMDGEEDLTEEMESLGSKWADSLDKGAGWDAMEGPISNMSAQGVTGNQMPKDMEIQGRSGEGREGRSSGEFVGAEAEGKGGRQTPTRMTPEPFSSGQVNDKSKDPAGGATGGGKKGGFGGEGLEGPGPQELKESLQRLQGKQAAIRNQAERLELQMKATSFANFKLIEANALMKKAEESLRTYHYNTALYYQKQAVKSLNTAKVLSNGEVHVREDTSPTMSPRTQKEIHDSLNGVMPKGYADPVKAYFTKIAEDAKKE